MNKNRQSDDNKNSLLVHQNWMNDWTEISFTDVQVKSCKENKNGFNYFHYLYDYGRVGTF